MHVNQKFSPVHLAARPCAVARKNGGGPASCALGAVDCPECSRSAAKIGGIAESFGEVVFIGLGLVLVTLACSL